MPGELKIFHSESTFIYKIQKEFCKVYFENNQNYLTIEIETTEDLFHVEEDSLQNQFPKLILYLDDLEILYTSIQELINKQLVVEQEESLNYSKLSIESDDFKILKNKILLTSDNNELVLNWKGKCEDFTQNTDELIAFQLICNISEQVEEDFDLFEEFEKIKEKKPKIPKSNLE